MLLKDIDAFRQAFVDGIELFHAGRITVAMELLRPDLPFADLRPVLTLAHGTTRPTLSGRRAQNLCSDVLRTNYCYDRLVGRLDTARVGEIETGFYANIGAVQGEGEAVPIDLGEVDFTPPSGSGC